MKNRWLGACLVLAALAGSTPAAAQAVQSDQQILLAFTQGWERAFRERDVAFVDSILADEFIATYADGTRGDRAKELALVAEFNQQIDSSRLDEFTVRIYGDTAVVMFTQHMVGPVQGKPTEVTHRYTDVWVIRDGRWLCVASHSTRVGGR